MYVNNLRFSSLVNLESTNSPGKKSSYKSYKAKNSFAETFSSPFQNIGFPYSSNPAVFNAKIAFTGKPSRDGIKLFSRCCSLRTLLLLCAKLIVVDHLKFFLSMLRVVKAISKPLFVNSPQFTIVYSKPVSNGVSRILIISVPLRL